MQEDNISFEEIGKDMIEKWNQFVYDLCARADDSEVCQGNMYDTLVVHSVPL